MADIVGGIISLAVALVFLSILVHAVPSVPLWLIVGVGFLAMVASFVESMRSGNGG